MADCVGPLDDRSALSLVALVDADPLEDVVLTKALDLVSLCLERLEDGRQGLHQDLDVTDGLEREISTLRASKEAEVAANAELQRRCDRLAAEKHALERERAALLAERSALQPRA